MSLLSIVPLSEILIRFSVIVIISLFVIVLLSLIMMREAADFQFGKFFEIVLKELPKSDFDSLVTSGKILRGYRHTYRSIFCIIEKIFEYGIENFSEEGKAILRRTINIYIDYCYDTKNRLRTKPKSIKNIMNMTFFEFFRYTILFVSHEDFTAETRKSRYLTIVILVFYIPIVYLWVHPNITAFIAATFSFIIEIVVSFSFFKKNFQNMISSLALSWITHFLNFIISPILLFNSSLFLEKGYNFLTLYSTFFVVIGLWLTNEIRKATEIRYKNKGAFAAHRKTFLLFWIKYIPKFYLIWLWITFFGIIIGTILMYALIYRCQLSLGNFQYCLCLSAAIYFRDGNFNLNSIEGKYFLSEVISSFLINTLYIAYILQFMFYSKNVE